MMIWAKKSPHFREKYLVLSYILKWYNFSKNIPKHFIFDNLSDKKNPFAEIAPQVSKLGFSHSDALKYLKRPIWQERTR